jgi:hypothetical protein
MNRPKLNPRAELKTLAWLRRIALWLASTFPTSQTIAGIKVHGGPEFIRCTQEALALLQNSAHFLEIQHYIAMIEQGRRSGMHASATKPTFVVGKLTWSHSPLWYAGAIAHDAYHSKLYHDAKSATGGIPPADCWTGKAAEQKCLTFQIEVLEALGADANTVAYLDELRKNPTYQGHNKGLRGWWDYLIRRW